MTLGVILCFDTLLHELTYMPLNCFFACASWVARYLKWHAVNGYLQWGFFVQSCLQVVEELVVEGFHRYHAGWTRKVKSGGGQSKSKSGPMHRADKEDGAGSGSGSGSDKEGAEHPEGDNSPSTGGGGGGPPTATTT